MKRRMPIVECDACHDQQVNNGDPTEVFGLTIKQAFYAGYSGGGPIPKDSFICVDCVNGNDEHGPILLECLVQLIWLEPGERLLPLYAPKKE